MISRFMVRVEEDNLSAGLFGKLSLFGPYELTFQGTSAICQALAPCPWNWQDAEGLPAKSCISHTIIAVMHHEPISDIMMSLGDLKIVDDNFCVFREMAV